MPKSDNQKLKLLYIKKFLEEKTDPEHGVTVSAIKDYLEKYDISAERKSIYSDIDYLARFGMDIFTDESGRAYRYSVDSRLFELSELKLLSDAVSTFKFINQKELRELLAKISSLTSEYEARKLKREIRLTGRTGALEKNVINTIDFIHSALNDNFQLTFKYLDWTVDKKKVYRHNGQEYKVSPWALIFDDEKYYLMAYDHNSKAIRNYRVDRMDKVSIKEENRLGKEEFEKINLDDYTSIVFSMYSGDIENVTLEFSNSLVNVVIDQFGTGRTFVKTDENHFSIVAKVAVSDQFFGWLAGLGKNVRIISPADVRNKYEKHLADIIDNY